HGELSHEKVCRVRYHTCYRLTGKNPTAHRSTRRNSHVETQHPRRRRSGHRGDTRTRVLPQSFRNSRNDRERTPGGSHRHTPLHARAAGPPPRTGTPATPAPAISPFHHLRRPQ